MLVSNPLKIDQIIVDEDLPKLKGFAKLSRLSLRKGGGR